MAKIVLIGQNQDSAELKHELELLGYEVMDTSLGQLRILSFEEYQLIILNTSVKNIPETVAQIRAQYSFHYTPILGVTAQEIQPDKLDSLLKQSQIDDVISSASPKLAATKVGKFLQRLNLSQNLNPLTHLPGNPVINKEIEERIIKGETDNAIVYFDLNNFKPYNDYYGFLAGDWVIKSVAEIAQRVLVKNPRQDFFIGHIGGDDFVIILPVAQVNIVIGEIMAKFAEALRNFYQPLDYERGCIISYNRSGQRQKFDLMGLTFVSFSNRGQHFKNLTEVGESAGTLKQLAKSKGRRIKNSIWLSEKDVKITTGEFSLLKMAEARKIPLPFRRAVIEAMGEAKETQYEDILITLLDKDLPYLLKKSTIYALGRLRSQKALPELLKLLHHSNPHLRTRAVEAIGNIGLPEGIAGIKDALQDDNRWVRRMAALTLGKLGERRVIPALRECLETTQDKELKKNILISLGQLEDETSGPLILKLVKSKDIALKRRAIWALGKLKYKPAIPVLLGIFRQEPPAVKYEIGVALREFGSQIESQFIPQIIQNSYAESPAVRRTFVDILGNLNYKGVDARLGECLEEKSEFVRWKAVIALARKKKQVAIKPLINKLKDRSVVVRLAACYGLGELGSSEALISLRLALKDEDEKVRQEAARAIIKISKSHRW